MIGKCDMIVMDVNSGNCDYWHVSPMKRAPIYETFEASDGKQLNMLHCSGSQENMVTNNDFSTYSVDRKMAFFYSNLLKISIFQLGKSLITVLK